MKKVISTKVMMEARRFCHLRLSLLYLYLDDWLREAASEDQAKQDICFLVGLCRSLG